MILIDSRTKLKLGNLLPLAAWLLVAIVLVLAFSSWAQTLRWHFSDVSTYQLFPIFGLIAFSTMWTHYVISALRKGLQLKRATLDNYYRITSYLVLISIVLHPGLLVWQLWRDGFGLPPGSYLRYVGPSLRVAVLIGSASFFIFLAYEFHRIFRQMAWWRYLEWATDLAMIGIFYHGSVLGTQTHGGWFRIVWFFYGLSLIGILAYKYIAPPIKEGLNQKINVTKAK